MKKSTKPASEGDFESLVDIICEIHQQTQSFATKAVNAALTLRNWLIGQRIVEFEQQGRDRTKYGEKLLGTLAKRLAAAGLSRVEPRELRRFRLLYATYQQIRETLSPELLAQSGLPTLAPLIHLATVGKRESLTPESQIVESATPQLIHRLSFTPLNELIQLCLLNHAAPALT